MTAMPSVVAAKALAAWSVLKGKSRRNLKIKGSNRPSCELALELVAEERRERVALSDAFEQGKGGGNARRIESHGQRVGVVAALRLAALPARPKNGSGVCMFRRRRVYETLVARRLLDLHHDFCFAKSKRQSLLGLSPR